MWTNGQLEKKCSHYKNRDVFEFDRICIMGGEMDNFKRSAVITEIEMCSGCQMKIRDVFEFDWICIMGGEMDDFERRVVITEIEMCSGYQNANPRIWALLPWSHRSNLHHGRRNGQFWKKCSRYRNRDEFGVSNANPRIWALLPWNHRSKLHHGWRNGQLLKEVSPSQISRCVRIW